MAAHTHRHLLEDLGREAMAAREVSPCPVHPHSVLSEATIIAEEETSVAYHVRKP